MAQDSLHAQVVAVRGLTVVGRASGAYVAVADARIGVGKGNFVELFGDHWISDAIGRWWGCRFCV